MGLHAFFKKALVGESFVVLVVFYCWRVCWVWVSGDLGFSSGFEWVYSVNVVAAFVVSEVRSCLRWPVCHQLFDTSGALLEGRGGFGGRLCHV